MPLMYREGADSTADRPAHVRAASGLAWVGRRLVVIQDDANFLAVLDPTEARRSGSFGGAEVVHLPAGHAGLRQFDERRGNKGHKLDLESCFTFGAGAETTLVALGSGSTPARERILMVTGLQEETPRVELLGAHELYAALRGTPEFAGAELNLEGAVLLGERNLRLFGRGNGASREGREPVNATCDLDWPGLRSYLHDRSLPPPTPRSIVRYDLGDIDGVALGFTDAMEWEGGILFSAAAEASPDAVQDGAVAGSAIGIIPDAAAPRWMSILDEHGSHFRGKLEGLARGPERGTVYAVADEDDPSRPSELCLIRIDGL